MGILIVKINLPENVIFDQNIAIFLSLLSWHNQGQLHDIKKKE